MLLNLVLQLHWSRLNIIPKHFNAGIAPLTPISHAFPPPGKELIKLLLLLPLESDKGSCEVVTRLSS